MERDDRSELEFLEPLCEHPAPRAAFRSALREQFTSSVPAKLSRRELSVAEAAQAAEIEDEDPLLTQLRELGERDTLPAPDFRNRLLGEFQDDARGPRSVPVSPRGDREATASVAAPRRPWAASLAWFAAAASVALLTWLWTQAEGQGSPGSPSEEQIAEAQPEADQPQPRLLNNRGELVLDGRPFDLTRPFAELIDALEGADTIEVGEEPVSLLLEGGLAIMLHEGTQLSDGWLRYSPNGEAVSVDVEMGAFAFSLNPKGSIQSVEVSSRHFEFSSKEGFHWLIVQPQEASALAMEGLGEVIENFEGTSHQVEGGNMLLMMNGLVGQSAVEYCMEQPGFAELMETLEEFQSAFQGR